MKFISTSKIVYYHRTCLYHTQFYFIKMFLHLDIAIKNIIGGKWTVEENVILFVGKKGFFYCYFWRKMDLIFKGK